MKLKLLTTEANWLAWKQDNLWDDDEVPKPDEFPCYMFTQVKDWYEEIVEAVYLYRQDLEAMLAKMQTNTFKYSIGDIVAIDGLVENIQFNGTIVTVVGLRPLTPNEYCKSGRGYYVNIDLPWGDDFIYEERLKPIFAQKTLSDKEAT